MSHKCISCGLVNFGTATVCRRCKTPFGPRCPGCGRSLPSDATFCSGCGTIVSEDKIDVAGYKTKSQRSRSFDEERAATAVKSDESPPQGYKYEQEIHRYKRCPECWAKISREAPICTFCGTQLTDVEPETATQPTPVAAKVAAARPAQPTTAVAAEEPAAAETKTEPPSIEAMKAAIAGGKRKKKGKTTAKKAKAKTPKPAPEPEIEPEPEPEPEPALPPREIIPFEKTDLVLELLPVEGGRVRVRANGDTEVAVDSFVLGAQPVTCREYKVFLDATGHPAPGDWLDDEYLPGKAEHPVALVSFFDSWLFCQWAGVRLPTMAEWAAAFSGADDRRFPWGDTPDDAEPRTSTYVIGSRPGREGPFGHRDLTGNVRQWVFSPDKKVDEIALRNSDVPQGRFGIAGASYFDPLIVGEHGQTNVQRNPNLRDYAIGFRYAADQK